MRKESLTIACAALILLGCEKAETITIEGKEYVSASACAKRLPDGQVVECNPSEDSKDNLSRIIKQSRKIDKENPGPRSPDILSTEKTEWHRVEAINEFGVIKLINGVELFPAGLECETRHIVDSLKGSFIRDASAKLAYTSSGLKKGKVEYAYIWALGFTDDPNFGPTLSSVNENLIISEFCKPIDQEHHAYHHRYQRINGVW